jgi:hypothetical protein
MTFYPLFKDIRASFFLASWFEISPLQHYFQDKDQRSRIQSSLTTTQSRGLTHIQPTAITTITITIIQLKTQRHISPHLHRNLLSISAS